MDNLSPLVKKVMERAEAEAAALLSEAEADATAIAQKASVEASRRSGEIHAKAESNGQELARRAQVQASMTIKNAILAEKGRWVEEIMNDLPTKLRALNDKDYASMFRGFVLSSAPMGLVHVLPSENDKEIFGSSFVKGINELLQTKGQDTTLILTGETSGISGGLILKGENVSVDCSLDSISSYFADELEPIIAEALFSDEQGH